MGWSLGHSHFVTLSIRGLASPNRLTPCRWQRALAHLAHAIVCCVRAPAPAPNSVSCALLVQARGGDTCGDTGHKACSTSDGQIRHGPGLRCARGCRRAGCERHWLPEQRARWAG